MALLKDTMKSDAHSGVWNQHKCESYKCVDSLYT